jgi:predicted MFS family arabinose efflux permease
MNKRAFLLSIGGLLAMAAAMGVGRFVYTPILPPMVEAIPLTKAQAGLIASANFLGYLAGAILAAVRLPGTRRFWLLASLAVTATCLLGMGLATTMPAFIALRLVAGAASAFALIFSSALVIDRLSAAGQGALSAVHFSGVGVGIAVSAAIVAGLLHIGAAWTTLWFASAAIAGTMSLAVIWLVPPDDMTAQTARTASGTPLSRDFVALLLAYGLFGFGYVITATFIVDMVRGTSSIAPLEPYIWVLFGLCAVPSVALWTALGQRWGVLRIYAVACIVEALGVAASALWLHPASIVISAVFVGGTFVSLTALGLVATRSSGGDPRGRIALMTVWFSIGQIVGPAFAGYVYDATGSLAMPLLVAVAALMLAAVLSLAADARRRALSPSR